MAKNRLARIVDFHEDRQEAIIGAGRVHIGFIFDSKGGLRETGRELPGERITDRQQTWIPSPAFGEARKLARAALRDHQKRLQRKAVQLPLF